MKLSIGRCAAILLAGGLPFAGASAPLPAFPGAEGFGRFATGGRGGSVYHVTNLSDSGPGSFRDAVSQANRTVVFDVGGVIPITRRVAVASNLTLAGQTAPGDGITIYGNGVSFSGANNTITRFLRFRMGVRGDAGKDALGIANGHDLVFDHISVSWGRDENFSINGPVTNVTIQNSIIAQGLQPHSAGGLIQTSGGVSILRTLYADNHTRNPKVKGVNQFVNNVLYNWGSGGGYILGDSAGDSFANVIGNYFITGPSTSVPAFTRGNVNFRLFAADNWLDSDKDGTLNGSVLARSAYTTVNWQEQPFDYPPVRTLAAAAAVKTVAAQAGASLRRDEVDERLITELLSFGKLGQIITAETNAPMNGAGTVRGAPAPLDTDQDGMPDDWEWAGRLNPKDAEDRNQVGADDYTQLEIYLDWLTRPHAAIPANGSIEVDLRPFARGFAQPTFSVGKPEQGTVTLANGHLARFTAARGAAGCGGFQFTATDADGTSLTSSFGAFITEPPPLR